MLLIERFSVGRLFHAAGAATLNARLPNVRLEERAGRT